MGEQRPDLVSQLADLLSERQKQGDVLTQTVGDRGKASQVKGNQKRSRSDANKFFVVSVWTCLGLPDGAPAGKKRFSLSYARIGEGAAPYHC
jgi:hypothetical protein